MSTVYIYIFVFAFSCSERRPIGRAADARYIEDSSNESLLSLDKINSQDFTRAANQLLQDLYENGALAKAPNQPVILHIGEIRNDTQTYFDTDLLIQSMKRDLLASNRVLISTTDGMKDKISDQYAKEARLKIDSLDPSATGSPNPYFSLSGKIIEETSRVDKVTQKDFYFLLTLTEINNGTGVWFGRELISKQGRRGSIGF